MAFVPEPASPALLHRRGRALDGLGLLLAAIAAGWTVIASMDRPEARPAPVLALLAGMVLLVAVGRRFAASDPPLVPGLLATAVAGALVLGYPAILRAGGAPTGYANSNASLAAIGAVAAGAAAALTDQRRARQAWAGLAMVLAGGVLATGSVAASSALAIATALALTAVLSRQLAVALAGGVVAVSLVLGVTVAIGAGGDPLGLRSRDELRSELWSRAVDQVRAEPIRGVGPGISAPRVPTRIDADLRWAHHDYLQQAAEQGVVGLLLMVAVIGWVVARLWIGRTRSPARTLAGATALTTVALHASVDHILHTAAVPLSLALLVGWATADLANRESPGSRRPHR